MKSLNVKKIRLERRKLRIRSKIKGTADRPRLSIYKSNKHIYVQAIDDINRKTICGDSTIKDKANPTRELATKLAKSFYEKLVASNIKNVVFDRNGYMFHGVIKSFADSLRESGINL